MTDFEVIIVLTGMLFLSINQVIASARAVKHERFNKNKMFILQNINLKLSEIIDSIGSLAKDQQEIKTRLTWMRKRDNKTLKGVKKIVKKTTKSKNAKKK